MVLISKPSREFRRHHDVEAPQVDERAFRQGWRVRTRLDQLLADERISRSEWQAAIEFRAAWGAAIEITRAGMIGVQGGGSPDNAMLTRLDAVERLRLVEAAIGGFAASLCRACIAHDLAWAAIGRQCGRNPETVRDWTVLAIRAMAGAWGAPGRRKGRSPLSADGGPPGRPVRASWGP